jgi:hypothetical protein
MPTAAVTVCRGEGQAAEKPVVQKATLGQQGRGKFLTADVGVWRGVWLERPNGCSGDSCRTADVSRMRMQTAVPDRDGTPPKSPANLVRRWHM